jgi:endonuclease/exonuclease/phosphatase family metal-dependent hydrolase
MKTSENVYYRILSDKQLNPCNFKITYYDSIKDKYIDVAVLQWKPIKNGGDIPWTRVYFIKFKNEIIWDRNNRVYDIDGCVEKDDYMPFDFKIMSFNVLSDIYDKKITDMTKRKDKLIEFIDETNCDVVCLQEITDEFHDDLKKYFDNKYFINITDAKVNNIVILSKINPVGCDIISLDNNSNKKAINVTIKMNDIININIVGIHLTSDTHKNSKSVRIQQISKIKKKLNLDNDNNPCIILGDTNEIDGIEQLSEFVDSNNSVKITYNPQENYFAKKFSSKGFGCRYDRIYHHKLSCDNFLVIENNELSDHYPVIGDYHLINECTTDEINCSSSKIIETSYKTSLCVIPPHNIQQELPNYNPNWMPHINIFWGFIPESKFNEYYVLLNKIKIDPFNLVLNEIDTFEHDENITVYLKPSKESIEKLREIHSKYSSIFPLKDTSEFNPHLSIDSVNKNSFNKNNYNYNVSFNVDSLFMTSREKTEKVLIKKIINFNKKEIDIDNKINEIIYFLESFGCSVKICGSRMLKLKQIGDDISDLDLLCIGEIDRSDFYNKLMTPMLQCGLFYKYEIIKNNNIYSIKLFSSYMSVDLQYVNNNNKSDRYYMTSYNMYGQMNYAITIINDKLELFKECLMWLKLLLKFNKIYGQMYGYLSGMSILILTIFIIKKHNINNLDEFIKKLGEIEFDDIISLSHTTYNKKTKSDELIIIQELTRPYENTVRNITKSTKAILLDIFKNHKLTIILPHIINFYFKSCDEASREYFEELNNFMSAMITKFVIRIEKNTNSIVKPHDKWYLSDNNENLYFRIRHNCESNLIDHETDKIKNYAESLIESHNITFHVIKKHIH